MAALFGFDAPDPLNLPPPLMTSEPGSFARRTIVERKPQLIRQAIADNDYPPEIVAALDALRAEIAQHPVRLLAEPAPDAPFWNGEVAAYRGKTWLELPWYLAETYFYRRLLEAVRYLAPGPWQGHDPFGRPKRQTEREAVAWFAADWERLDGVGPDLSFEALLYSCLWGNRADLSSFTVREQARSGLAARQERHNLLIDHTGRVAALLSAGVQRVDLVNDNTGREMLSDLALADFMLNQGWAQRVVFHLKDRPFFVSDAMPQDVRAILDLLHQDDQASASLPAQDLGQRLEEHLAAGQLLLRSAPFWTSCLMFRQMPPDLAGELAQADLVLLKGDVNYRRLLGDRHWPHTARLEEIAAYFPAPFLVLRTLKGEIMVGLEPGQADQLAVQDPTWLINGKRGIIQLQATDR
jgi:Damage-control phosphatase ARMT1-like domain